MQRCILGLAAILVLGFVMPQTAVAQMSTENGRFGSRTLGQPIKPRASQFDGGIQNGESGLFLRAGRSGNAAAFATPWRRIEPLQPVQSIIDPLLAVRMAPNPIMQPQPTPSDRRSPAVYPADALPMAASSTTGNPNVATGLQPTE